MIVMLLTVLLVRGIRESARTNNIMVFLKIVAILVFVTSRPNSFIRRTIIPLHRTDGREF